MTVHEMENKINELQKIIIEKDEEITRLKGSNPRGAGRKRADDKWIESFNRFVKHYESHDLINETMKEVGISRATYYRYKNLYDATNLKN